MKYYNNATTFQYVIVYCEDLTTGPEKSGGVFPNT